MLSSIQREQYKTICILEKAKKSAKKALLKFHQKHRGLTTRYAASKHEELAIYFGTAYDQFIDYKQTLERKYRFKFPIECETAGDDRIYYADYFKNKIIEKAREVVC